MKTIRLIFLFLLSASVPMVAAPTPFTPTPGLPGEEGKYPPRFGDCELLKKLYAAYDSGDLAYIEKVRKANIKDGFLNPLCRLLEYKAGVIPARLFITAFPETEWDYGTFCGNVCHGAPCRIYGENAVGDPFEPYYEELFKLMERGSRPAMKKILNSWAWADGEAAEYLDFRFSYFYFDHADVVLNNFELFKDHLVLEVFAPAYEMCPKVKKMEEVVRKSGADVQAREKFLNAMKINAAECYKGEKEADAHASAPVVALPTPSSDHPLIERDSSGREFVVLHNNRALIQKGPGGNEYFEYGGTRYSTSPWRDMVLVMFKDGLTDSQKEEVLGVYGEFKWLHDRAKNSYSIKLKGITVRDAVKSLKKDPRVRSAEADGPVFMYSFE